MSLEKCHGRKRIQPLVDADAFKILKQAADRQPRVMTLPEGLYSAPWKRTSARCQRGATGRALPW